MCALYVKIYYGPYESFHHLDHKPLKIRGLRDYLQKLGYRVDLCPVEFENHCLLEMCGHEVFRCNIKNLSYNTHSQLDPVCQKAVDAVLEATVKFRRARSCMWCYTMLHESLFRSLKYGPKDHFINKLDCNDCCNITNNM